MWWYSNTFNNNFWSTSPYAFFRSNSVMIIWCCLFLACLILWVSSSVFYCPWYCSPEAFLYVQLNKFVLEKKVAHSTSNIQWIYFSKSRLKCYWTGVRRYHIGTLFVNQNSWMHASNSSGISVLSNNAILFYAWRFSIWDILLGL